MRYQLPKIMKITNISGNKVDRTVDNVTTTYMRIWFNGEYRWFIVVGGNLYEVSSHVLIFTLENEFRAQEAEDFAEDKFA